MVGHSSQECAMDEEVVELHSKVSSDKIGRISSSIDLPAICMSSTEWNFLAQRQQHIMRRYSRQAPVLFVDPVKLSAFHTLLNLNNPDLHQVLPHLWSLSLEKVIPTEDESKPKKSLGSALAMRLPQLGHINSLLTRIMAHRAAERLGIEEHILWCYRYDSAAFIHKKNTQLVVYDCVDDWSAFGETARDVRSQENRLVAMSDVVFTTSKRIYERKRAINPNTYFVPNGVDYNHFSSESKNRRIPSPLEHISEPMIGFTGATYSWIDLDLVETIAVRRPEWSFVFVGPISKDVRPPHLPNIHFLKKVPYEVLPQYIAAFDVCLLPFRQTELTESVDPIKMYEYLAVGRPIVSTSIPEVQKFSDIIHIVDNASDFEKAIIQALKDDSQEDVSARQKIAAQHSWDNRFKRMLEVIADRCEGLGI